MSTAIPRRATTRRSTSRATTTSRPIGNASGTHAFWDGVRRYYEEYSFRIGGTKKLLDILDEEAGGAGGGHETRFPSLYPGQGG